MICLFVTKRCMIVHMFDARFFIFKMLCMLHQLLYVMMSRRNLYAKKDTDLIK